MPDLPLPRAQLAALRGQVAAHFPDTYRCERVTRTPDEAGGAAETSAIAGAGPCLLRRRGGGDERPLGGRASVTARYDVELPLAADVRVGDALLIAGHRLRVIDVTRGGQWAMKATARCQEVG